MARPPPWKKLARTHIGSKQQKKKRTRHQLN